MILMMVMTSYDDGDDDVNIIIVADGLYKLTDTEIALFNTMSIYQYLER